MPRVKSVLGFHPAGRSISRSSWRLPRERKRNRGAAGRAKERWRIDAGVEEKTDSEKEIKGGKRENVCVRETERERERNYEIAFDIRRIEITAVNLGDDRNLRTENSVFERYINKLRFVFDEVEVVFDYNRIVRTSDRSRLRTKELRETMR